MELASKISITQTLVENDPAATSDLISVYLSDAEAAILRRLYPFSNRSQNDGIPAKYEMLQCKLAARYFLRRGAEGESFHEENGVNRHYNSVNDEDLLMEVTPMAWYPGA